MIYDNIRKISDIFYEGRRIIKGYFYKNLENILVYIFRRGTYVNGYRELNTGDCCKYTLEIDSSIFSNINIECENTDAIINNNSVTFTKAGSYKLNISYENYKQTINVDVEDVELKFI